jgi:transposase
MALSRRIYTREFKVNAVRELEAGGSLGEVARAIEVLPSVLGRWRNEYQADPGQAFPGSGVVAESTAGREAELERKVGQLTMENDFLKKTLARLSRGLRSSGANGGRWSTKRSKAK